MPYKDKAAANAYRKAWYASSADGRERAKAQSKAWYASNKARKAATGKAWRESHPERMAELQQSWHESNPGRMSAIAHASYERNREAVLARTTAWRKDNIDSVRDRHYFQKYGLAPGQYAAMLQEQGGCCEICGKAPGKYRLHVDHDHVSGRVRALLCSRCNTLVANIESPLFEQALAYKRHWDTTAALEEAANEKEVTP